MMPTPDPDCIQSEENANLGEVVEMLIESIGMGFSIDFTQPM